MKKVFTTLTLASMALLSAGVANAQTALPAKNAYAYDITVEKAGDVATVSYKLNAPATAVKVQVWNGETMVKEVDGTLDATDTDNTNTAQINVADLAEGSYSVKVQVESPALTEAAEYTKAYRFYHPAGVAIDKNPESPYFGRLYVTECMPTTGEDYQSHNAADQQGLYVFDQTLSPVTNAAGTYAFKGGQTFQTGLAGKTAYDPRKVRITDDGRVLVSGQNPTGSVLWEVNPNDLNAAWTPVIAGTPNADTYELLDADGNFIAAPNVSMDVKGTGADLKVLMLSTNAKGVGFSYSGYRTDEYNLGTATSWTAAPSANINLLSGQFTITHTNTTVAYDNEGGIWYNNSRSAATAEQPSLVHVNAEGAIDYIEETNTRYGGGAIAFNADFTRLAVASSNYTIIVYGVSKDAEGKPVLTEQLSFATNIGRNCNDIAWDCADNLYIVGNSGEWLKVHSLPRESGICTVPAASKYNIVISAAPEDTTPAEMYIVGQVNGYEWDANQYTTLTKTAPGVYEATITSFADDNFVVTEATGDWTAINSARYGQAVDNARIRVNSDVQLQKVNDSGALRIPYAGEWKVKFDYNTKVISLISEAVTVPENLYLVGSVEGITEWDPTSYITFDKGTHEGVFVTTVTANAGANFAVSGAAGDWASFNASRFGATVNNANVALYTEDQKNLNDIYTGNENAFRFENGAVYEVTVDILALTMQVVAKSEIVISYPETLYVIGTIDATTQWNPAEGIALTKDEVSQSKYFGRSIALYPAAGDTEGMAYFAFTSVSSSAWSEVNANRYGPVANNTVVTEDEVAVLGKYADTSYKVTPNTYNMVVDLEAGTLKLTKVADGGIESVVDAIGVVAGKGAINILGEGTTTSIYTVSGKAVVLNSTAKAFNVEAGMYIVNVNGKSTKVLVK